MTMSPTAIGFSTVMLSESLYALLLIMGVLIWWRWQSQLRERAVGQATRWAALCGLAFGCAALVRPIPLLILPVLCLLVLLRHRQSRSWWISLAVCLGAMLLTLLPWIVRNYRVTGHPIVTTLWSGPTLYDGLQPKATGRSDMTFFDEDRLLDRMSEYDMNREYSRRAWKAVIAEPGRCLSLALRKQLLFWSVVPSAVELRSGLIRTMTGVFLLPFLMLAVLGLVRSRIQRDARLLILIPVAVTASLHLVLVGSMRYRFPVEFLLAIPAAAVISAWAIPRGEPDSCAGAV